MKYRKLLALTLSLALALVFLAGCGGGEGAKTEGFDDSKVISVVTRESGSGTRGAFIELFKIEVKEGETKKDLTTANAITTNKTDVVLSTIAGNEYAIGYVSVGSLNASVKALRIDGNAATTANVKSGAYQISRPFIIATQGAADALTQDFIGFILSKEGQAVIEANNYVSVQDEAAAYVKAKAAGKLVVAGSSSVAPVLEKLKEAYEEINSDVKVEIQITDSSAGLKTLANGTCNLAMSSRALTAEESAQLTATTIAMDGIAVIVSQDNPLDELTSEQVRQVFTGELTTWGDLR